MKDYMSWKEEVKVSAFPEFKLNYVTRHWVQVLLDKFENTLEYHSDLRMMVDPEKFEPCIKTILVSLKSNPFFREYQEASLEFKQCIARGPEAKNWDSGYRLQNLNDKLKKCEEKLFADAIDPFKKMLAKQQAYRIRSLNEMIPAPFSRDYFYSSRSKDFNLLFTEAELTSEIDYSLFSTHVIFSQELINLITSYIFTYSWSKNFNMLFTGTYQDPLTSEVDSSLMASHVILPKELIKLITLYLTENSGNETRFAKLLKDFELIRDIWSLKSLNDLTEYPVRNFIDIMNQTVADPQGEIELKWLEDGRFGTTYPSIAAAYQVLVDKLSIESCLTACQKYLNAEELWYIELFVSLGLEIMGTHKVLTSSTFMLAKEFKGIPDLLNLKLALNEKIQQEFGITNGITIITRMPSFSGQLIICAQKSVINYLLSLSIQAETTTDTEFKWSASGFKKAAQERVISCLSPFTQVVEEKKSYFNFSFSFRSKSSSSTPSSNKNQMVELQGQCKQLIDGITDEHNEVDGVLALEAIYEHLLLTYIKIPSDEAVRSALADALKKTAQLRTDCACLYNPMQKVTKTSKMSTNSSFIAGTNEKYFVNSVNMLVTLLTPFADKEPKQWKRLKDNDDKYIGIEIGLNGVSGRPSLATANTMIVLTSESKLIVLDKNNEFKPMNGARSKIEIMNYARTILNVTPEPMKLQLQSIYNVFKDKKSSLDIMKDWSESESGGLSP